MAPAFLPRVPLERSAFYVFLYTFITQMLNFTSRLLSLLRRCLRCKCNSVETILPTNMAVLWFLDAGVTGSGLAGDEARMSNMGCFRSGYGFVPSRFERC